MNAITTISSRLPMPSQDARITPDYWRVLTDAIFPAAKSPEAIVLAIAYCRARKLDIMKRPVNIVSMWNSSLRREVETVWPGINELQTTASRTGMWAGMDAPEWGPMKRKTFISTSNDGADRKVEIEFPEWCSVTIYRIVSGQRCAFSEPVYWLESYGQGKGGFPTPMWVKRPRGQLHKNAKAAALRAAFPEEMGNDYTSDEMEGQVIDMGGIDVAPPSLTRPIDAIEHDAMPTLPAPDKLEAMTDRLRARAADCKTLDALHELANDIKVVAGRAMILKARPDLDDSITDSFAYMHDTLRPAADAEPGEASAKLPWGE